MGNVSNRQFFYENFKEEIGKEEDLMEKTMEEVKEDEKKTQGYETKIAMNNKLNFGNDFEHTGISNMANPKAKELFPSLMELKKAKGIIEVNEVAKDEDYEPPFSDKQVKDAQEKINSFDNNAGQDTEKYIENLGIIGEKNKKYPVFKNLDEREIE